MCVGFIFIRTNLPKEIMGFPDYPFPSSSHSFILSDEVLSYLLSYAEHFKLNELIKFKKYVVHVRPIKSTNKWLVKSIKISYIKIIACCHVMMIDS